MATQDPRYFCDLLSVPFTGSGFYYWMITCIFNSNVHNVSKGKSVITGNICPGPFKSLDKDPQLPVTSPAWAVGCGRPLTSQDRMTGSQRATVCAEPLPCVGITGAAETLPSWGTWELCCWNLYLL